MPQLDSPTGTGWNLTALLAQKWYFAPYRWKFYLKVSQSVALLKLLQVLLADDWPFLALILFRQEEKDEVTGYSCCKFGSKVSKDLITSPSTHKKNILRLIFNVPNLLFQFGGSILYKSCYDEGRTWREKSPTWKCVG